MFSTQPKSGNIFAKIFDLRTSVLLLFIVLSISSLAQKKNKKGVYDNYWKQQERLEKFEAKTEEAHKQFQEGKLKLALATYEEALALKPKDQKTIAKIRDIKILLEKKDLQKDITINSQDSIAELTQITETIKTDRIKVDTIVDEAEVKVHPSETQVKEEQTSESVPKSVKIKETQKKEIKTIENKIEPVKTEEIPKDKPYKNTENFRKYLATLYKEGWTEEAYNEGNKKIIKRIHIYGDRGDEYQQVTHHYGAVFYFKNGLSITYGTWIAETKNKK